MEPKIIKSCPEIYVLQSYNLVQSAVMFQIRYKASQVHPKIKTQMTENVLV